MSPADYSDQTALVQGLFIQHLPALRGFVQSFVRDWALVDDVVQETFTTVNSKAGDFQRGTNFRGWVWTIARFKALQLLEKKPTAGQALAPEVIEALCAQEKAEYWPLADRIEHLGSCMAELAPKARLAVELRYQQAHRPPEIARRMGWSIIEMAVSASAFIPARKATRAAGGTYMVRPVFRADNLGTWVLLTSVFDAKAGTLVHYFNGEMISSDRPYFRPPLHLESCEIGNRVAIPVEESERERVRRFEGCMDEFGGFAEAMPAADVRRIYETGRPGAITTK